MAYRRLSVLAALAGLLVSAATSELHAQLDYQPAEMVPSAVAMPSETILGGDINKDIIEQEAMRSAATSNPMLWNQYQALQTGSASVADGCQNCGTSSGITDYNRCGCNAGIFPWVQGPGSFDQWCVGPKWGVEAGGLFMFRDDVDWGSVTTAAGGNSALPGYLAQQFDHAFGGRVFVTGYNDAGFGIQVGYEGINDWEGTLTLAPGDPVVGESRNFTYQSRLNSVEINFLPNSPRVWKLFSGFRYVQLDEDFIDLAREDRVLPAPDTTETFTDQSTIRLLENQLFGIQLGGRRDAWNWGQRLTLSTFANAGVYCNKLSRDDVDLTVTTTVAGDDSSTTTVTELTESSSSFRTTTRNNSTEIAFVGEAGLTAFWRLNPVTTVQAGYQVLVIDGVGQGVDAFLSPNVGQENSSLVFHGLQFGLEYRR